MSQDDIVKVLKKYPQGTTRKVIKQELNLVWIAASEIRALRYKEIIEIVKTEDGGIPIYRLIGEPEEKIII